MENRVNVRPGYWVDKEGGVYTSASGSSPLKPSVRGGYYAVNIGGRKEAVHRLVAESFCPNPDKKPLVNHIDGNKLNCSAVNLEWCTAAENSRHASITGLCRKTRRGRPVEQICPRTQAVLAKHDSLLAAAKAVGLSTQSNLAKVVDHPTRQAGGFLWRSAKDPELAKEEWALVAACDGYDLSSPPYYVSSFGRIRGGKLGRLLSPHVSVTSGGYQVITLLTGGSRRLFLVHRLVATVFSGPPDNSRDLVVNHKDRDKSNNCAENLEWVTQAVNTQKAIGRPVLQLDTNGEALAMYPSQTLAASAIGVDHTAIYRAIRLGHKCCGHHWAYAVQPKAGVLEEPSACLTDSELDSLLGNISG